MAHTHDLESGKKTLMLAADALQQQATLLDQNFVQALDILDAAKGRIIVSGMGKSGHVGRKIAATFASTGRPAQFVHPAEASHGDLGMITPADVVIALSGSGETNELKDLLNYCQRFSVKLIAITGGQTSTLAKYADVNLFLVKAPEACPNQQAPTTSTTLTLAMGDALAVALMNRRGFTADDFRQFHPGGKLGGQLVKVRDIMRGVDVLPLAKASQTVGDVLPIMNAKHNFGAFGCAIIVDDAGCLIGLVTDGDVRRNLDANLWQTPVANIMTTTPKTIDIDALANKALAIMTEQNLLTQLLVLDGLTPVGVVRLHDIMQAGVR